VPLYLERRGRMFYIRGTAGPKGRRVAVNESTGTDRRELAEEELARREAEIFRAGVYGERAAVLFADAAASYQDAKPHLSAGDLKHLRRLVTHFAAAKLSAITQAACDRACRALVGAAATPATKLRAVITPLSAVLTHAARRGWCERPAFERPPPGPARTDWLTPADADRLIAAAAEHLRPLMVFLLGTGARAGEAIGLRWSDVDLTAGTVVFRNVPGEHARRTKSGRDRLAHLPPRAIAALGGLPHRDGAVFLRPGPWRQGIGEDGKPRMVHGAPMPYQGERGQFRTGWDAAWRRAGLAGHMSPHSARHSWASWRYCVRSDALDLMRAGGWSSLDLVARYAHQCPVDLAPAIVAFWGAHPDQFPAAVRARGRSAQIPRSSERKSGKSG
jgi:integrase